jgi:CubicO group peptidase (beta-lactamase class C family)
MVTLVAKGDEVHIDALGEVDIATHRPMREDTIFRIQSMTKPLTAVATLRLIEQGVLALDTPVDRWLPELSQRSVLRAPDSPLSDTVPANRPITVEDLLTCRSGYGMVIGYSPLSPIHQEMIDRGLEPGPLPHTESADTWIAKYRDMPLLHQPGEGWRYHISFDILGVLIARVTDRPFAEYLSMQVCGPLDMPDTGFWVEEGKRDRLAAAYMATEDGFDESEPAGGGYYAGQPSFDVSHGELVSTARDYHRFARMLMNHGMLDGQRLIAAESVKAMLTDHIPASQKTPDSFFPGFWETNGWGYGISVVTAPGENGERVGQYGWGGGLGTNWFNDPSTGTIVIFLAQVFAESVTEAVDALTQKVLGATAP